MLIFGRHFAIVIVPVLYLLFLAGATMHTIQKRTFPVSLQPGETVCIGGTWLTNPDEIEFYASWDRDGKEEPVLYRSASGAVRTATVRPEPYYTVEQIVIGPVVSLIIFFLGYFVFLSRPGHDLTKIFYACTSATASAVAGVQTIYSLHPRPLGNLLYLIFALSYGLIPILFFHFTRKFIHAGHRVVDDRIRWGYIFSMLLVLLQVIFYLNAAEHRSLGTYNTAKIFGMIENSFMFLLILAGIGGVVRYYIGSTSKPTRKKIRLIMFGLSVGTAPFVFFWVLPIALGGQPLISEVIFKVVLLVIPITFVIAIFRHQAMDIDVFIRRSFVYTVVIAVILLIYSAVVSVVVSFLGLSTSPVSTVLSAVVAVAVTLAVQPLIRRVRTTVDKTFFRIEYDYRQSFRRLQAAMQESFDLRTLSGQLVAQISKILPTERIAIAFLEPKTDYLKIYAHTGYDVLDRHGLRFQRNRLFASLRNPISLREFVEPSVRFEEIDADFQQRWGIALIVPILEHSEEPKGFIVLGPKKSGVRFTEEDIDLLVAVGRQAGEISDRLFLQERLLLEHAETERLAELNRMKSYFVSSVSHDMKTPLTSIKMFAEIIRTKPRAEAEVKQYLKIIEGETDRLTRLINNVLDFSKIERGTKEYRFELVDLAALVRQVVATLEYQLASEQVTLETDFADEEIIVEADPDAVTEAVINLITNGVKYSSDKKRIRIGVKCDNGEACIAVADAGIGIPSGELREIFQPFYRTTEGRARSGGGVGLGLSIVKHIVDAHKGRIDVDSTPGQGSTFTLRFPLFSPTA